MVIVFDYKVVQGTTLKVSHAFFFFTLKTKCFKCVDLSIMTNGYLISRYFGKNLYLICPFIVKESLTRCLKIVDFKKILRNSCNEECISKSLHHYVILLIKMTCQ